VRGLIVYSTYATKDKITPYLVGVVHSKLPFLIDLSSLEPILGKSGRRGGRGRKKKRRKRKRMKNHALKVVPAQKFGIRKPRKL
jgi:hypothetical protein